MALDPDVKAFATGGKNFAALTTMLPSGQPSTQIVWVDADDDHVLINTETGRQKFRNIEHDARVTVTVWDETNPYRYVEARGTVEETVTGPEARAHIDACAKRYMGVDDYPNPIETERVLLKIAVDRVHKFNV